MNITSPLNFNRGVTAENVNFKNLYNGVNVTQFIENITHYAEYSNYKHNYERLLSIAHNVHNSLIGKFIKFKLNQKSYIFIYSF